MKYIDEKFNNYQEKISLEDKVKLEKFFVEFDNIKFADDNEKKKIKDDFCIAFKYYINNNFNINDSLGLIDLKYLGDFYSKNSKRIFELDDSGKILSLLTSYDFTSMFRISVCLKEDVVPEILQVALNFTIKRFPSYATKFKRGFFWHYLEESRKRYYIQEENDIPSQPIDFSNRNSQLFRILYFKNRISIEVFHALTDGNGGIKFLTSLLGEYFRLIGKNIVLDDTVIDINGNIDEGELENAYDKVSLNHNVLSKKEKSVIPLNDYLYKNRPCQVIHFKLDSEKLKLVSKKYNTTITGYFLSLMFVANKFICKEKNGDFGILIPFNIRKLYDTKTLHNFTLYSIMRLSSDDLFSFYSVIKNVNDKIKDISSEDTVIECVTLMKKILSFMGKIPLIMKRTGSKLFYGFYSKRTASSVFSNLGVIKLPKTISENIESIDSCMNTAVKNCNLCSVITINNVTTFSITKLSKNSEFEEKIYELLCNDGIVPKVEGSEIYED